MTGQVGQRSNRSCDVRAYVGTFLIAFSTLALEITVTRLLSVTGWYYLAFFAVSTAMLGMTAGATTVYLKPGKFTRENVSENVTMSCLGYSFVIPVTLVMLCMTPLVQVQSVVSLLRLLFTTIACSLPFYFSGIAISLVLTKYPLPIGKLYASDLIGASLGCVFVLGGLEVLDAPSLILLCSSGGALAALSFSHGSPFAKIRRLAGWAFPVLVILAVVNSTSGYGIRPLYAKGSMRRPGIIEKWNSYSCVKVEKEVEEHPQYWGMSPVAPRDLLVHQHHMDIDGEAATTVRRYASREDIDHLRFDVTNLVYFLRPHGVACIIGVGGGRDVQSAILFGHEKVVALDVNPIFIALLRGPFRQFAGITDHEGVRLVVDEARSFLSRTDEVYSVIQMSMIDTWAATGAGAFTLSENSLYTEEAWNVFYHRLSDDGMFTVSRWHNPKNLGETGRVASLAVASLLRLGITEPAKYIAMVTAGNISTLLVSKRPFEESDTERLREVCLELKYDCVVIPGVPPEDTTLRGIISSRSAEDLDESLERSSYNIAPPTDEDPYFFNMLRLRSIMQHPGSEPGVIRGNIFATQTLIGLILSLFVLTLITIIVPLATRTRMERRTGGSGRFLWAAAFYFSLIGAGFMCIEIGLVQRLSVFLGHPIYALGILLSTIIASAGIGSFISESLPIWRSRWLLALPVVTGATVVIEQQALRMLVSAMITSPISVRIAASVATIFPLGILLGFFFPIGMRLARSAVETEMAWYWGLNGVFGLLFTALAVFFSIYSGISTNFYVGAACYLAVVICLWQMSRGHQSRRANG
jgi:hypothetical protein